MEEKINDNVVKAETTEDETKKKIDWLEWMIHDLIYRLSRLEDENRKLKENFDDAIQDKDYKISCIDNKYYMLETKLSDYSKYILEMTNDYVTNHSHMTVSTE